MVTATKEIKLNLQEFVNFKELAPAGSWEYRISHGKIYVSATIALFKSLGF